MQAIIKKYENLHDQIVKAVTPSAATFDNVIRPLAELQNEVQGEIAVIDMLQYGSADLDTQEASCKAHQLWQEAEAAWRGRADLFRLISAVQDKDEFLDHESKLWVKQELLEYTLLGYGTLNPDEIEEVARKKQPSVL